MPQAMTNTLVSFNAPWSIGGERYQGLRWKLERLQQSRGVKVVAVTSACVSDGKTVTAINLAGALASADNRVLLIDADLRRPSVGTLLGLDMPYSSGLGDVVGNVVGDDKFLLHNVVRGLETNPYVSVLLAGSRPLPVPELLRSPRFARLLQTARSQFGFVIIDTPPLLPVNDAAVLSELVDGMLMVVAAHKTARRHLEHALSMFDESKVLGLVFNGEDAPRRERHDMYYQR